MVVGVAAIIAKCHTSYLRTVPLTVISFRDCSNFYYLSVRENQDNLTLRVKNATVASTLLSFPTKHTFFLQSGVRHLFVSILNQQQGFFAFHYLILIGIRLSDIDPLLSYATLPMSNFECQTYSNIQIFSFFEIRTLTSHRILTIFYFGSYYNNVF